MALVTNNIGTGQTYTTIASWMASAPTLGTDIWHGVLTDNKDYNEEADLTTTGTGTSTSYVWLDVDSSVRHSGTAGSGARISTGGTAPTSGQMVTIDNEFTRVSWLEVYLSAADSSDEGFDILTTAADNTLIEKCIIWTDSATLDTDGIYFANDANITLSVDNCIIYGFTRGGIHYQNTVIDTTNTITINIDYCSIFDIGEESDVDSGCVVVDTVGVSTAETVTFNVYNTWASTNLTNSNPDYYAHDGSGNAPLGTVTWNGSNLLYENSGTYLFGGTDNTTSTTQITDVVDTTQSTGTYVVVNSLTAGSEDLLLLDDAAGNFPVEAASDRTGSEPDSRQDFSVDIAGNSRTVSFDIGAHEFSSSVPPDTPTITTPAESATVSSPVDFVITYNDPDSDPLAKVSIRREVPL